MTAYIDRKAGEIGARCADAALTGVAENMREALRRDLDRLNPEFRLGWLAACDAMDRYARIYRDQLDS